MVDEAPEIVVKLVGLVFQVRGGGGQLDLGQALSTDSLAFGVADRCLRGKAQVVELGRVELDGTWATGMNINRQADIKQSDVGFLFFV